MGSRPPSPVHSDSELEIGQRLKVGVASTAAKKQEEEQSWEWGQLPSSSTMGQKEGVDSAEQAGRGTSSAPNKSLELGKMSEQGSILQNSISAEKTFRINFRILDIDPSEKTHMLYKFI
jgi:hypothetical protein